MHSHAGANRLSHTSHPRLSAARAAWRRIHLVDRCLILVMAVLLIQSAYTLFFPGESTQLSGNIDIVIRTSAAAIFGYFLSANFAVRDPEGGQVPAGAPAHRIESAETVSGSSVKNQIGFVADTAAAEAGSIQVSEPAAGCGGPQVLAAACIGLFCLAVLILLRNWGQGAISPAASDSLTATITQFRDFVSGCVGFLIGCPSSQRSS